MLEKYPRGIVSVVSDSYNVWNVCENIWGEELKDMIVERGRHGGRLVVRPDSGDPEKVVVKVRTCSAVLYYSLPWVFIEVIFAGIGDSGPCIWHQDQLQRIQGFAIILECFAR